MGDNLSPKNLCGAGQTAGLGYNRRRSWGNRKARQRVVALAGQGQPKRWLGLGREQSGGIRALLDYLGRHYSQQL